MKLLFFRCVERTLLCSSRFVELTLLTACIDRNDRVENSSVQLADRNTSSRRNVEWSTAVVYDASSYACGDCPIAAQSQWFSMRSFLAAIAFYTVIPLPRSWPLHFDRVARWLPVIGVGIGGVLAAVDVLLKPLVPPAVRSLLVVSLWLGIAGGLHLDGAMDTADGLGAGDRSVRGTQRRLQAMSDSATGAFGVMAAIVLLLMKWIGGMHLPEPRWVWWLLLPAWGRWAQLLAISFYPYLKPEGKGKFLKDTLKDWDAIGATLGLALVLLVLRLTGFLTTSVALWTAISMAIAVLTGAWFQSKFGGQTGDTYGAIVEWTEALSAIAASIYIV